MAVWVRMSAVLFLLSVVFSIGQSSDELMKRFERMEFELEKLTKRVSELELKDKAQSEKNRRLQKGLVTCETQILDIRTQNMANRGEIKVLNENIEQLKASGDQIMSYSNATDERHKDILKLILPVTPPRKSFVPPKKGQGIEAGNPSIEEFRPSSSKSRSVLFIFTINNGN